MTQLMTRLIPALALVTASIAAPAFAGSGSQISTMSAPGGVAVDERERGIWPTGLRIATSGTSVSVPSALVLLPDERGQISGDTVTLSRFPAHDRSQGYAAPRR